MNNMRKMFALAMVALLGLTLALTVVGCGQQAAETPASSTETMPMGDEMMHSDSAMTDSTMAP